MKRIESAIQAAIIRWVKETHPHVMITATANERSYKETNQIGSLGIPDLLLFDKRERFLHVLFLELKKKEGKLLQSQKDWARDFHLNHMSNNTWYAVAYGYEQAREQITNWLK